MKISEMHNKANQLNSQDVTNILLIFILNFINELKLVIITFNKAKIILLAIYTVSSNYPY